MSLASFLFHFSLSGKTFAFRGCGWSRDTNIHWSQEDKVWINIIVDLLAKLFGEDFLDYVYTANHGTVVAELSDPRKSFTYDHELWEATYEATCQEQSINNPVSSADSLKQLANGTSAASNSSPLD